jgi:signal peptidase I
MYGMAERRHGLLFHLFDVVLNIVIILAVVGLIRTFLVSPFRVEGNSMTDTLEHQEYIIINKFAYYVGDPVRGDVVVFRPPNDRDKHYVKRIIGTPGDTVIIRSGKVYLKVAGTEDEVELTEPYLNERNSGHTYQHPPSSGNTREVSFEVPEGQYFLLGDNRQGSLDSRSFTPTSFVEAEEISGRVWFVALPISKIHALEPPEYGI